MKLLIILFSFYQAQYTQPSDSTPAKHRIYKTTVVSMNAKEYTGYLGNILDTALYLSSVATPYGSGINQNAMNAYAYPDISYAQLKRKGSAGRGALIGAASGFALGALIGLISGDDPHIRPEDDFLGLGEAFRMTAGEKALGGGLLLSGAGAIAGTIIGAVIKKKFIIGGKKENFDAMRLSVMDKVYGKQLP